MMGMMGMRRKNNGRNTVMMSLVGLGVGAAAYGLMRGRNNNGNDGNDTMQPVQRAFNQMQD